MYNMIIKNEEKRVKTDIFMQIFAFVVRSNCDIFFNSFCVFLYSSSKTNTISHLNSSLQTNFNNTIHTKEHYDNFCKINKEI